MKNLILYKGYHSPEAFKTFIESYKSDDLVLFLPPTLDDYSFTEHLPYDNVIQRGELWEEQYTFKTSTSDPFKEKPLCGLFTSGTSETAKLVLYSKANLEASIGGITELFKSVKTNNIFCYPQPFHTFGLTLGFAGSLIKDWPMTFASGKYSKNHHQRWFDSINENTLTLGTPTHFYDLISWVKENKLKPPPSAGCIIGGALVKKDLWFDIKKYLNIENPSIGYGATEASPGVTHLNPGLEPQEDGEIGIPLSHVKTTITNDGLLFSGPNLCLATLQGGKLNFPKDYLLPDIVNIREKDGVWLYKARSKWFINRGGEKFSLEKIEQDIFKNTGFEILCFPLKDERLGEELGMIIQSDFDSFQQKRDQVFVSLKNLFLRDFNKNYAIPLQQIPLNESQKRDRKKSLEIFCKRLK